jgi:hypothetical protein
MRLVQKYEAFVQDAYVNDQGEEFFYTDEVRCCVMCHQAAQWISLRFRNYFCSEWCFQYARDWVRQGFSPPERLAHLPESPKGG